MSSQVIRGRKEVSFSPIELFQHWLEGRWVFPAYSGGLLALLALCFFGAATNTLSGWLYVISGVIGALLLIGAILPPRSLRGIQLKRLAIEPVSVGDTLTIELVIENLTRQPKNLLELYDQLPVKLSRPRRLPLGHLPAQGHYTWSYALPTDRRGIFRWYEVELRTATPLGLFWCRRVRSAKATAIVYPTVLSLASCPLIDEIGEDINPQFQSNRRAQMATEGLTRALRPYRWGDSTRLIHWRTSARYSELRVRELEVFTGGQEIIISLDSAATWDAEDFEQAVIATASLYFYALRRQCAVKLWTAGTGLLHQETPISSDAGRMSWQTSRAALEALAATFAGEDAFGPPPQETPLIWLTPNVASVSGLPEGSRWVLWPGTRQGTQTDGLALSHRGLVIRSDEALQHQLQCAP